MQAANAAHGTNIISAENRVEQLSRLSATRRPARITGTPVAAAAKAPWNRRVRTSRIRAGRASSSPNAARRVVGSNETLIGYVANCGRRRLAKSRRRVAGCRDGRLDARSCAGRRRGPQRPHKEDQKSAATFALPAARAALWILAAAQFVKPDDSIKYRSSAMFMQSTYFGRIAAMANGRIPCDESAAMQRGTRGDDLATPVEWRLCARHGRGNAEPAIWNDAAKFKVTSA